MDGAVIPNKMTEQGAADDSSYIRIGIVTSEHPKRPLDGTILAFSSGLDFEIPEDAFDKLLPEAHERVDVSSYATELRLATLYLTAENNEVVGVDWMDSPTPHEHNEFSELVSELPESLEAVFPPES